MKAKYIFYKLFSKSNVSPVFDASYKLSIFKPSIFRLSAHSRFRVINLFWFILTIGRYCIYYVSDETGQIVHYSYVMPKIFKFSFMDEPNSIHIGPCWTKPSHRGKGIYPAVLIRICSDNLGVYIYIFAETGNVSSRKGIEKVGFEKKSIGYKAGFLGIYKERNG